MKLLRQMQALMQIQKDALLTIEVLEIGGADREGDGGFLVRALD